MSKPEWISATGINYGTFNYLLSSRHWYAADQEMVPLMLKMIQCSGEAGLTPRGLEAIAAEDLQLLDRLWMQHSDGQFGLSPQRQLWRSWRQRGANGTGDGDNWLELWRSLTWHLGKDWFQYPKISLAQGQLPFWIWHGQGRLRPQQGKTWQAYRAEFQKTAQLMEVLFSREDW